MSPPSKASPVGLHFGALAPRPSKQVRLPPEEAKHFDKDADAIDRLLVRGIISDSEAKRARQRLVNQIAKKVLP